MFEKLYQDALTFLRNRDSSLYILFSKAGPPNYLISIEKKGLFALLICAIIGQKISFTRAQSARKRLYTKLGKSDFIPDDIKDFTKNDWLAIGVEQFQINIIETIIKEYYLKNIKFDSLDDLDNWFKIDGVGQWTLDNIRIMYSASTLKKLPDIILTTDLVVKSALKSIYNQNKLDKLFIQQKMKDWYDDTTHQSYVGIINWYIWRHWREYQKEILKKI